MKFILGGDSFANTDIKNLDDNYLSSIDGLSKYLFFDHSKEYPNSKELLSILLKNNLISANNIFIKTPVNLRKFYRADKIYNFLLTELDELKINKCATLFLNKLNINNLKDFINSNYYEKLFNSELNSTLSLILGEEICPLTQKLLNNNKLKLEYISVLSNLFSCFSRKILKNTNSKLILRSIFSSGFLTKFISSNSKQFSSSDPITKFANFEKEKKFLNLLLREKILTLENCFHIPLHLSEANGICVASSKSKHLEEIRNFIETHEKYINNNQEIIEKYKSLVKGYKFNLQN